MCGFYILIGSILEKCGKFWKNGRFSGRIWPDWGNAARADLAGLGPIGLNMVQPTLSDVFPSGHAGYERLGPPGRPAQKEACRPSGRYEPGRATCHDTQRNH